MMGGMGEHGGAGNKDNWGGNGDMVKPNDMPNPDSTTSDSNN